ncbi:MAG: nucleoside-diphosphate sugar epimerase [Bacteroidetes bacterium QH_2_63_10]|nr:MAG: nucleoside-diphosphate sugar epimerase [Bacteroidetes bacterium QH_2_63_10]
MQYLITGGAGFIGSHLTDRLIEQGHHVHVFDNLSTGKLDNVRHWVDHSRFTLTISSVLNKHTLGQCIAECDRVVHLAAAVAVGVERIMDRPVDTILTNVRGTENVLQVARHHDTKTLVASTSEVYGKAMSKNGGGPSLGETDDLTIGATTKRRWAYACSKAMDEFLAQAYYDEHDLPVLCVRFFNTVGPRQSGNYGMVVPSFVERALAGKSLEVHGDGTQTRCFVHVADAVRATMELLETPAAEGEVFNVGRPEEISIRKLAERVRSLVDPDVGITHVPHEEVYGEGFEDMQRRVPDLSKLKAIIGYEPRFSMDEILQDVIDDVRARRSGDPVSAGRVNGSV